MNYFEPSADNPDWADNHIARIAVGVPLILPRFYIIFGLSREKNIYQRHQL